MTKGTRLAGKIALITGGGSGIGKAIAKCFVAEGATVVLAARNVENLEKTVKEIEAMGGKAVGIPTDITVESQVINAVQKTIDQFGQIDILVNNSGTGGPNCPVVEMKTDEWMETIMTDLTGSMLCSREVLKHMIPRKSGNIIAIGAEGGRVYAGISGYVNRSPYAAAKAGLAALIEAMAIEVGQYNIRVNQISAAGVNGPRVQWVLGNLAKRQGKTIEEVTAENVVRYSLGRFTEESQIGDVAVFLASEEASAITGQTINAHSGYHA